MSIKNHYGWTSAKSLAKELNINEDIIENYKLLELELNKRGIKYKRDEWVSENNKESQIYIDIYYKNLVYNLVYNYWNLWSSVSNGYELDSTINIDKINIDKIN